MGYFKCQKSNKAFNFPSASNTEAKRYYSLSLIHPAQEERGKLSDKGNSYRVITRKGKRENNSYRGAENFRFEKDKIFMLKEGSIFSFDIKGSSPVVYPKYEGDDEIRDFGYAYRIEF